MFGRKRKTVEQEGRLGLPPEIWLQIFGYLDEAEAIAASQVCQLWRELVFDDEHIHQTVLLQREQGAEVIEKRNQEEKERKKTMGTMARELP